MANAKKYNEVTLAKKMEIFKLKDSSLHSNRKSAEMFCIGRTQVNTIIKHKGEYTAALGSATL